MRKFIIILFCALGVFGCAEKLIDKPDNFIPRDQMVAILKDMAILNAARTTNVNVLKENGIEPTEHIFEKYAIDSTIFVENDRYYASLPLEYVSIYEEVEAILIKDIEDLEELKKISDSLKLKERKALLKNNDSLKGPTKFSSSPK